MYILATILMLSCGRKSALAATVPRNENVSRILIQLQ